MCGLVGIISSNMLTKHRDALAALLYLDTWRGRDSTGVAALRVNADTAVMKSTVPGYEFVEGPQLEQHLRTSDFAWIGHNRYGTVGKNIKSNAHPFTIDDEDGGCMIVGAHNGTLKNKHVLDDERRYGTDSEAMFYNIAKNGLEETMGKLEGAWALTYYDHIAEEMRFLRNKERPLMYAWEKDRKTLIWASEMWMIRVVCNRCGIELEDDKVYAFAEDTLYRIPVPLRLNQVLEMERKGGLVGKTSTFFPPQTGGTGSGSQPLTGNYSRQGSQSQTGSNTQSGTTNSLAGGKQQKKNGTSSSGQQRLNQQNASNVRSILTAKSHVDASKLYKGFRGEILTKKELDDQLENGCAWCELEFVDPNGRYAWLAKSKPICSKCLDGVEHEDDKKIDHLKYGLPPSAAIN